MSPRAPILVVGDSDGLTARELHASGLEWVADMDVCLDRMSWFQTADQPVCMVAITAGVPQPLTLGRRLRSIDRHVGLGYIVPHGDVAAMQSRLALVPDLTDVVVLSSGEPRDMGIRLRRAADDAIRRSHFTQALEVMNRDIGTTSRDKPVSPRPGVTEHYLAALTRHAPDAIVSVDAHGCVVASNAAADRILELDGLDIEGTSLRALVRAHDREQLARMVTSVIDGTSQEDAEMSVERADGTSGLLSITAAPVHDRDGAVVGGVFLARDITDKRRTDERLQQLQRAEGLATMAAGVAHDFNNLLVVVQGWLTLAAADPGNVTQVCEALGHIQTASERAAELAQAMLAYGGQAQIDPQARDLSELVQEMQPLLAVLVPKTIDLSMDLAADLPDVLVDASELQQVVTNLVTNAAEAIGAEPGTIRIRTSRAVPEVGSAADLADPRQDGVVIEVSDSGPGMDQDTAARIFDLYFSTKFVGRGLGLAASSGIVRAHGGTLTVDTRPGAGARFRVTLPSARKVAT